MSAEGGRPERRDARPLAEVAAEVAVGGGGELTEVLVRAAEEAGPRAVEEVLLQSHLFVGFPRTLAALRTWRGLEAGRGGRQPDGTGGADPPSGEASSDTERRARGEEVCRRVYGSAYPGLRENVRRLHPAVDDWMVRHGYGEVLGRGGLDLATRELCIVATLAADGAPAAPLHSHLRGALRAGAGTAAVEEALEAGLRRRDEAGRPEQVRRLWREVREEWQGAGER